MERYNDVKREIIPIVHKRDGFLENIVGVWRKTVVPKELKPDHIHEYVRVNKLDGSPDTSRYRCAHPDCHHLMAKNLLIGKRSICAVCHVKEIILDRESLKRAKPNCFACSNTKQARAVRSRLAEFQEMFKEETDPAPPDETGIDTGGGIFYTGGTNK